MTTLPYLHHELIIQILLKLPVKSLIQFKCVCKSWFSFISDPNFANSHFELTSATHTRRILSISLHSPPQIRSIDFELSLSNDSALLNLNFLLPRPYFPPNIRGSCRGFIFLHCSSIIYLWNPSTGFHKQIPLSPFDIKLKEYHFDHLYGFGYDQSRDDYLVVSLSYDPTIADNNSPNLEFFSLRDSTWKQIDMEGTHFPYMVSANDHRKLGVLFKGAIHWLAFRCDLKVFVIVAFDLMERKLLEYMPLPDDFYHQTSYCGLCVFGEFLNLWAMKEHSRQFQMWVMKDSKLHSSWTNTLALLTHGVTPNFSPICSTKNGDVIGTDGGPGLVKYNAKGKLLEYHSYYNNSVGSKVVMYTESLLSLPGDCEQVYEDDTNKKNEVLKYSPSLFS